MSDKKTLLITGGLGYIGSHAVVAFEQAGYKTVIIDNLVNSSTDTLVGIEKILGYRPDFHEIDIRDKDGLEDLFSKYEFDGVIHFAGLKAVGESCQNIHNYQDNNVRGSITLFGAMEQYGVRNIVFSSSATVYDAKNPIPYIEGMQTGSSNPYGTSKLVIEKLMEDYATYAGWSVVSLRYFNPIGAHSSGWIGELPNGIPNNLLPYALDVALGKREKVQVFGNDYPTIDGTGVRDYIDINDLIDAHTLVYQNSIPGFEVFNVGTGKGVSVLEIIREIEKISDKKIPYDFVPRRAGDLSEFFANANKISHAYGWKAKRTLHDSVASAWNFIKRRVE